MNTTKIAAAFFDIEGKTLECAPFGNGHINDTYLLRVNGEKYLLQRVNEKVFRDPARLMENIERVTEYLLGHTTDPRTVRRIIKTKAGGRLFVDGSDHWRVFHFVDGGFCYEQVPDARALEQAGEIFGRFLCRLSSFPADTLYVSIPGFHDTAARLKALERAFAADSEGRAREVAAEMDFCRKYAAQAGVIERLLSEGRLPLRVTHNDTKLNNALFDEQTGDALCVIDLDTVMPGSALYDFGDAIRSSASKCAEDEPDTSKAGLRLDYFEGFTRGFLREMRDLTDLEREMLPFGAKMMCLECGVRFLTDYLSGDTYFKISRPSQNLDRCRTQLKMVEDLENLDGEIRQIMERL